MKISTWDNTIYNHHVRWAIRRLSKSSLSDREDWIECLTLLDKFEEEIFRDVKDADSDNFISFKKFSSICHSYIDDAKKNNKFTVAYFFFKILNDSQYYFEDYEPPFNFNKYLVKATPEEIEQATKDFGIYQTNLDEKVHESKHTFDNAEVLEYRGVRFILDNEWSNAWIKNDDKIYTFQLIWDWYYPIDEFIELYMK